jgi:hypothetical protein
VAGARLSLVLALSLLAAAAAAEPVERSPRPEPRPASALPAAEAALPVRETSLRPRPKPAGLVRAAAPAPEAEPEAEAAPARRETPRRTRKGSVCGDADIRGRALDPIRGKWKGCGIAEPVEITEVDGVRLSQPAIVDCATASALKLWVQKGLRPAFPRAEVARLEVAAHYNCRTRNNVKGAKVSEHGRGRAIDVSAIVFTDGTVLSVARNWNKAMRRAYKAACGIFRTTLGPGSDGYHEDHMHFDTASRRSNVCR